MRFNAIRLATAATLLASTAYAQTPTRQLNATDIITALGYTPANAAMPAGGGSSATTSVACGIASATVSGCVTVSTGLLSTQGALSVIYGTTAGTAAQGNDSRLGLASTALQPSALTPYATLLNPTFSGIPTAPTAAPGTNSPQLATTGFVANAISGLSTGSSTYTLPPATNTTIGGVKASARIAVASDGTEDLAQQGAATGQVLTWNGSFWAPSTVSSGSSSYTLPAASNSTLGGVTVSTGLNVATGALSVAYGTAAGTAAQGNDARFAAALQASNNLSDLASAATARGNLGLGTAATTNSNAYDPFGSAAAATNTAMQRTSNGSDIASVATFRTNLGLGTAATQPSTAFDASGAAAAATSTAAQKANNLSDLANAATARSNLGLGTAATTASTAYDPSGAGTTAAANALANSPALGGSPTATTPATSDNSTRVATTAFVKAQGYGTGGGGSSNVNAIAAGTAAPTSGSYTVGQFEQNSAPSEQGSAGAKYVTFGFVCIAAGSPGTWVPLNVFDGN